MGRHTPTTSPDTVSDTAFSPPEPSMPIHEGPPPNYYIISYALLESAIRPDFQPKSSKSHEAEPHGVLTTEGG